jgi:hypothetical protein
MSINKQVTHLIAVWLTGRRTIEPGREDSFVKHKHGSNESAIAGAAF